MARRSTAFDWSIENVDDLNEAIRRLGRATDDFRIPFRLIGSDWFRSNRKLFTLQSAGLYQDLAPARGIDGNPTTTSNYKKQKQKKLGFVYPIMVGATRVLSDSLLGAKNLGSVFTLRRQELFMGTRVPYAGFHQSDSPRSKMPLRKIVFIDGGPADRSKDSSISGRRERWLNIIDDHITQLVSGRIL